MIARIFAACLALCALTLTVSAAESAAVIRQRMEQRLPQIDELKAKGAIGENNRGLLEVREAAAGADLVVSAENTDRAAVYALIAQQTGATSDSVGKARAKQIAASAKSGVWVQDESGAWKKK
jgi:hypothetical protein